MPSASRDEQLRASNKALAATTASSGFLLLCTMIAFEGQVIGVNTLDDIEHALTWASVITLLGAVYYLQFLLCQACIRRRRKISQILPVKTESVTVYRDLPITDQGSESSSAYGLDRDGEDSPREDRRPPRASSISCPPEMTPFAIFMHAYGWGLVFFVTIYCVTGVYMSGANWWVLGSLVVFLDELLSYGAGKVWVLLIIVFLAISSFSVWWGAVGQFALNQSIAEILIGIVAPALVPFKLCDLRYDPKVLMFNGVSGLIKVALPFMVIVSSCVLVIQGIYDTSNDGEGHGGFNRRSMGRADAFSSNMSEQIVFVTTPAPFGNETVPILASNQTLFPSMQYLEDAARSYYPTKKLLAIMLAPVACLFFLQNLVVSVIENCATELVVGVTLCTAVRFGIGRDYDAISAMALSGGGLAFVFVLLLRRTR